jgi:anti-sigma-K factor RskA
MRKKEKVKKESKEEERKAAEKRKAEDKELDRLVDSWGKRFFGLGGALID